MVPSESEEAAALKLQVSPVQADVNDATGGVFVAVTDSLFAPAAPRLSVTVRVTVKLPAAGYECASEVPVPVVPSPKVQA